MSELPFLARAAVAPLRIFVVENHADSLVYLQIYLEECGHTVVAARTMAEALETLPESDCDVLLSDISLPDGDGWELLRRFREQRAIFAVAMSGLDRPKAQVRSEAAGYRHHLLKPFKAADLDAILREASSELPLVPHG